MAAVHAVKKAHAPTASKSTSGFSGSVKGDVKLGTLAGKELNLSAGLKAALDRSGALANGTARGQWFSADWFVGASYRFDPKTLQQAMSSRTSLNQLLGNAMMSANGATASDDGLVKQDFAAKPITAGAIIPAMLKETVYTAKDLLSPPMGYKQSDLDSWKPQIDQYKTDLRNLVSNLAHGATKLYLATWDNGDDTFYRAYVAMNSKTGEVRVLEDGNTG
jgi:hypothetical protein